MKTVIHIGPMKTGTTYVQNILHKNRKELLRLGWIYPGRLLNQQHACYGICGSDIPWVTDELSKKHEELGSALIKEIGEANLNVIISSEALGSLNPAGVENFLNKIDGADKVIATIRPLDKLLPSAWQQLVKGGSSKSMEAFLHKMAKDREGKLGLWRTYAYGETVKIWSQFLPVSVVKVSQSGEKEAAWNNFGEASGLPKIKPNSVKTKDSNISLNLESAEILRYINLKLKKEGRERAHIEKFSSFYMKHVILPLSNISRGTKIEFCKRDLSRIALWDAEEMSLVEKHADKIYGNDFLSIRSESNNESNIDKFLEEISLNLIQIWRKIESGGTQKK